MLGKQLFSFNFLVSFYFFVEHGKNSNLFMTLCYMHTYILMQMDGMRKVVVILLIGAFFMHSVMLLQYDSSNRVTASTLPKFYVDDDFNSTTSGWQSTHFDKIQDAINEAKSGDRIIVYDGLYEENIIIDKGISLFGEDVDNVIIDGGGKDSVVTITASNVDLSTFTIQNSGSNASDAGVKLTSSSEKCRIVENKITDCVFGFYVDRCDDTVFSQNHIYETTNATFFISSDKNTIEYNHIYNNENHGIFLNQSCKDNTIRKNTIYWNGLYGIYLNDRCEDNTISENQVYENENTGIRIEDYVRNSIVSENDVRENSNYGIFVVGSNTVVSDNIACFNQMHGIFLFADDSTTIIDNNASNNKLDGIRLQNSTGSVIATNIIRNNDRHGAYLNYYSIQNKIYDNLFAKNWLNAKDISPDTSQNEWYQSGSATPNIINGPFIAGNYWDDYTGVDENRDGLGDAPYYIEGGNKLDFYPLLYLSPLADAGGPYGGSVFESILFDASKSVDVNQSVNLSSFQWLFGDGTTKTGETVRHFFETPGNYTVEVTVRNNDGGTDTDKTFVIITPDELPPTIDVISQELVTSTSSTLFAIQALITDNVAVENVTISYWMDNASRKQTAIMDDTGSDIFEKTIILSESFDTFYCFITAVDASGNSADSKRPFAVFSSDTQVNVSQTINFDASESFDLDGEIISYEWDFGDGITKTGVKTTHVFSADGQYTVTLTVTDDDGNIDEAKKRISVQAAIPLLAGYETVLVVNNKGILSNNLTSPFMCYDTSGDGVFDLFVDPNGEITFISVVILDEEEVFLLSVDDLVGPDFLWMPRSNEIRWVNPVTPTVSKENVAIDYQSEEAVLTITVEESGWIWMDIEDSLYPDASLKTLNDVTNKKSVSDEFIWREDDQIYVLCRTVKTSTTYQLVFENIFPQITASFTPGDSGIIDEYNQVITISYNVPVSIEYATFNGVTVHDKIEQLDEKTFRYIPVGYWDDGTYTFTADVEAVYGSKFSTDSATYFYFQYAEPPQPSFIEQYGLMLVLISIVLGGGLFYGVCRFKGLSFDSYVYLKNRKLFPFVKPVILGPMSVTVDKGQVSKAEFYVDGALKETISEEPFVWQWNERGFLNHSVEAKVFDTNGKSLSSGEMSVFIINPFKWTPSAVDSVDKKEE